MDTYLYGLLGLSLAANAFSAISTLVANSKKRDEENQRTINSIYDELNRKIDNAAKLSNHNIREEIRNLSLEIGDARTAINQVEDNVCDRLCEVEYQIERLNEKAEPELCTASKKKRR
jgi:septal ring factor EnvC (AmiA/AmiB activator)